MQESSNIASKHKREKTLERGKVNIKPHRFRKDCKRKKKRKECHPPISSG